MPEDDKRSLKIDALADALEQMWSGGGEYGVYTVAVQRDKVRRLLHELLNPHEVPSNLPDSGFGGGS